MSDSPALSPTLRPSVPALAWVVAALWTGLVVAERAAWAFYSGGRFGGSLLVGAAPIALLAVWQLYTKRVSIGALCLAGLASGLLLGWLYWGDWRGDVAAVASVPAQQWRLEILADETVSQFGVNVPCRIVGGPLDGTRVTVQWPAKARVSPLGRLIDVAGNVKSPTTDARGERAARSGSIGTLRARTVRDVGWAPSVRGAVGRIRLWAVARMREVSGDGGALLSGVVVGDRRRLAGTSADADFKTTGLTHLVAVSGSHLVVVAAVIGWAATAAGAGRVSRSLIVAAVVGGYVVFSGVQPSAIRAWVMAVGAASAWLVGRRADGGSTLTVAAGVLLALSPPTAFDLGFQLSVAAVAGLVVFGRLSEAWVLAATGTLFRWVAAPVALTLTATAATIPITVGTFGMLSLVSPIANVAAGPLVSAALVLGLSGLVLSAAWAGGGALLLGLASLPATLAVHIAGSLARWPFAAVPLGLAAAPAGVACAVVGGLVWSAWPAPTRTKARGFILALATVMTLVAIGPPREPGATIEVLDVGQGDAILVRDGSRAVLVDAGPAVAPMRAALARAGVRRLDAVVITHLHADHYGGLGALQGVVRVPVVLVPAGAAASESPALRQARALVGTEGVAEVRAGSVLNVGALQLQVLWPRVPVRDAADNAASVVLRARTGTFDALLTGDAEGEVLTPLLDGDALGDIDVLKVGHHGSSGAATAENLDALRPEYSLISVGHGNRFGHPTPAMLGVLATAGSQVIRTDASGDITIRIEADGAYRVTVSRSTPRAAQVPVSAVVMRGLCVSRCATLKSKANPQALVAAHSTESHGQAALRVQARVPDIRRSRPPPGTGARDAQAKCGGARRPRLQL